MANHDTAPAIPSPEETAAHRAAEPGTYSDPAVRAAIRSTLPTTPDDQDWSTSGTSVDDMVSVMDVQVGDTILSPAHHHPVGPRVVKAVEETGLGRTLRFTNRTIAGYYRNGWVTMIARAPGETSAPTVDDVRHDPEFWISGPGYPVARKTQCPDGYYLTDSCPGCDARQDGTDTVTDRPPSPAKASILAALSVEEAKTLAESRPDLVALTDDDIKVIRALLADRKPTGAKVHAARSRGYVRWDADLGRRVVTPMGQVAYERRTPAPEPTLAEQQASGLRALADMIEANPELADNFSHTLGFSGIYLHRHTAEPVAEMAKVGRIARAFGAKTTKQVSEKQYNLVVDFGAVKALFLADRDEVCERVVTGTREVVEEVPDPVALAAVPTTTVTRVVEDVEWVCRPLLAGPQDAPVTA